MRPPSVFLGSAAAVLVVAGAVAAARVLADREDTGDVGPIVLYGDSLSWESAGPFTQAIAARQPDVEVIVRAVPGTAICDALDQMEDDVDELQPAVAVVEFVGNNATRCVEDLAGGDLAARYAADAAEATELLTGADTSVVWVGVPPAPGLPGGASELIDQIYRDLVDRTDDKDVLYQPAGTTVSGAGGAYVGHLPCLDDEGPEQGCADGEIPVRSPDRIHLCPVQPLNEPCPVYSSGSRRFGESVAEGALTALAARS